MEHLKGTSYTIFSMSQFCFKIKNLSVCPLHNVEAKQNLAEDAWNYPQFFNASQQEERITFSSPTLKYSLTPHVEGKGGYKNYKKTPCVSACQNVNYFLFKAYIRNKVVNNTNVSMFLWLALGALQKISNSKTMGNNNNNNIKISATLLIIVDILQK